LAQAPNGSAKAPADTQGTTMNSDSKAAGGMDHPAKVHRKKVAKRHDARSHKEHAAMHHGMEHASMHRGKHHGMEHAGMHRGMHHGAHAMGAGASTPMTDLDAGSRQRRMDQAYADFRARGGR
jgi:hypothetical protein